MKVISKLLFLFVILYSLPYSDEESIINNPILSNKTSYFINYKIIVLSRTISDLQIDNFNTFARHFNKILQHYDKLFYNSYVLSQDFFALKDNLNITYFLLENKLYKYKEDNREMEPLECELEPNFIFIDYINGKSTIENPIYKEVIIYGKKNERIIFYYIDSKRTVISDLKIDDTDINCKLLELLEKDCFICIYSQNNQINLSILYYTKDNYEIKIVHTYNESTNIFFSEINEPILYDTDKTNFKIICGRKKNNIGDIKCILANPTFEIKAEVEGAIDDFFGDGNVGNLDFKINFYNINEINTTFSSNDNNCNYTMFKSEYLICC